MTSLPSLSPDAAARCMDPNISRALDDLAEAEFEAAHWDKVCAGWTEMWGRQIWRQGHPCDRIKLSKRCYWRRRVRFLRNWIAARALRNWLPPGPGD